MPKKPRFITIFIKSHRDQSFSKPVNINYFDSLEKVSNMIGNLQVDQFYNKYGQKMPFSYQVPSNGLNLYIDQPTVSPEQWNDLLSVPKAEVSKIKVTYDQCLLSDSE